MPMQSRIVELGSVRPFVSDLAEVVANDEFVAVADARQRIPNVALLLKRQTLNTNRAIAVVCLDEVPPDFGSYLHQLRREVAFCCGFFPFFWGIGIQVVAIAPKIAQSNIDPDRYVAQIDNQWAIVQSVFLVDPEVPCFWWARSWGQFLTGKYQDAIAAVLARHFSARERLP